MVECMSEKLGNDTVNIGEDKAPPVMYGSVTVVFIHTMEDDQRLNTLVHEGDTLHFHFSIAR